MLEHAAPGAALWRMNYICYNHGAHSMWPLNPLPPTHLLQRAPQHPWQQVAVVQVAILLWQLHKVGQGVVCQHLRSMGGREGARQQTFRGCACQGLQGFDDMDGGGTPTTCPYLNTITSTPVVRANQWPMRPFFSPHLSQGLPPILTRLHSVPSAFQLVTLPTTLRNMGRAERPTSSAASRKLAQRPSRALARYSSMRRVPML